MNHRRRTTSRWLLPLAPLLAGVGLSLLLYSLADRNPTVYLSGQLSALAFALGVILALLLALGLLMADWAARRAATAVSQAAAQDRRRFLRRLDHELKNPLTAILAGLANVSAAEDEDARATAVHSVTTQVQRLRQLVADLRKLADLETRELEHAPVDLTGLLEDVFALAQAQPEAERRTLSLSIPRAPWPLPTIAGDRDLLFLAVYNVLDNALKFTQTGDTIELRAAEDDSQVLIEVGDTGPGIDAADLDHELKNPLTAI
ncbi:MAG: hypothetical protein KC425_03805, partial [Anaerolineales bacterium]|nr:hypothetical protein [Anaerolineales bacterium]